MFVLRVERNSTIIESKFTCLRHSEAKQTETSEFEADKGLLQVCARRQVAHDLKSPKFPEGFGQAFLKVRCGRGGSQPRLC